jgi:hypothetical protein
MRSPCFLCVCMSIPLHHLLKAGTNLHKTWYVHIGTWAHLNPSHQSLCIYVYALTVARQPLCKNVTAETNTNAIELLDASFTMRSVSHQGKQAISFSKNFVLLLILAWISYLQVNIAIKKTVVLSLISSEWLSYDGALCSHAMTITDNTAIFIHSQCMCYQLLKPGHPPEAEACAMYTGLSTPRTENFTLRLLQCYGFICRPRTNSFASVLWVNTRCHQLKMLTEFHEVFSINICRCSFQARLRSLKHSVRYVILTLRIYTFFGTYLRIRIRMILRINCEFFSLNSIQQLVFGMET